MNQRTVTAFFDEIGKIAQNAALATTPAQPASPASPAGGGGSSSLKPPPSMKAEASPTSYSSVNTQAPVMEFGAAMTSKSMSPPPIRT